MRRGPTRPEKAHSGLECVGSRNLPGRAQQSKWKFQLPMLRLNLEREKFAIT